MRFNHYTQVRQVYLHTIIFVTSIIHRARVMVLNATVNDISVILWRSVLLVEETGVRGENH